jgi:hypothetical protein
MVMSHQKHWLAARFTEAFHEVSPSHDSSGHPHYSWIHRRWLLDECREPRHYFRHDSGGNGQFSGNGQFNCAG